MNNYISTIKASGKPVAVYGMGNGAEKIIAFLNSNGIEVSCVFASDGFVRGQSFMGKRVLSFAEAEEKYGDFIVVTAFALEGKNSDLFYKLAEKHTLYAPNLPPYGSGYVDAVWIEKNRNAVDTVRSLLSDDISKEIYDSLLDYYITADINRLIDNDTPPEGWYGRTGIYAEVGAYDGKTAVSYAEKSPDYTEIYAFEPGKAAFRKLVENTSALRGINCVNAAVWEKDGFVGFGDGKGRGSGITGDGNEVKCVSLDSYFKSKAVSNIRIDGEGADMEILKGSANIIYRDSPSLCVAVYHRAYDLFDIPVWLKRQNPLYKFYLRRKRYVPAFDVFIYAVKK